MCGKCQVGYGYDYMILKIGSMARKEVLKMAFVNMFNDRVEQFNLREENERLAELFSDEKLQEEAQWQAYSVKEISRLFSISEEEALKLMNCGLFKTYRVGNEYRASKKSVEENKKIVKAVLTYQDKKTMSVPDVMRILGLGKTATYRLINQCRFKTYLVLGKMRVDVDSFEDWYAGQFHYEKVNGERPGKKYGKTLSPLILALAINLSFACSLRMGEMLGLTWDCIDISEESLKENNASIFVDKELQRVNRDVMEVLDNKDIIRVFPRTLSNTNTSLVLKTPKTKTSVRKIFLPSTVAQMLLERKKQIDEMKELFGDEYLDYDLVFCHSSGRPMEGQVINRALKKLIQDNDLPDVVFHSFRHASITYKLKWNGGDMKSVQGDSGHARMDMVADVYSHIIDEDRRYNAQKFEEQFYNAKGLKNAEEGKTAPMPKFETSVELLDPMAEVQKESEVEKEKPAENSTDENAALLTKLLSNPETAALLKALAKTI